MTLVCWSILHFFRGHTSPSLCIASPFCDRLVHAYFSATTWNSVAQTQVGRTVVMSTGLKPHPIDWACLNIGFPVVFWKHLIHKPFQLETLASLWVKLDAVCSWRHYWDVPIFPINILVFKLNLKSRRHKQKYIITPTHLEFLQPTSSDVCLFALKHIFYFASKNRSESFHPGFPWKMGPCIEGIMYIHEAVNPSETQPMDTMRRAQPRLKGTWQGKMELGRIARMRNICIYIYNSTSWWFQPLRKILVNMGIFPK